MSKSKRLFVLLMVISLLFGCNKDVETQQVDFNLITSEKGLPTNFEDIAFKQGTKKYLVKNPLIHQNLMRIGHCMD